MKCKAILIALFVGTISMPTFSQETSHQKTLSAIQELKAQLIQPKTVKTTAGKLIRPNQPATEPRPMLVDANEPTPAVGGPVEQYRVQLPQRSVLVDVPPPVIQVQQAPIQVQTQQAPPIVQQLQVPPVIVLQQDNGNGPTPPQPQPPINPPDPDRDIQDVREQMMRMYSLNAHFRVKRGIIGLGVLPCVSFKPRLVTDPVYQRYNYMQDYLRRKQVEAWINSQFATIQPVPEYQPAVSAYGRYR